MRPFVKQERSDEAEIQELAIKIREANKAKMQQQARAPPPGPTAPLQNMSILNFLTRGAAKPGAKPDCAAGTAAEPSRGLDDEESVRGRFGWTTIGKMHIPYITRSNEKYCAVRMVELRVLNKYLNFLHQDIYNCTCIRSYYITEAECRLLNEINIKHCDYYFGREHFSLRDLIVRLSDAHEFYKFLDACYNKLLNGMGDPIDRCGFIRINKESVVPYTVYNNQKYVPLFYFEGETENLKLKADKLEGWDLSYLKFCCKVQGIRNELFAHDSCAVISLNNITNYFPPGTLFEDYWPSKVVDSQLLINGKTQTQAAQWTRQPVGPPVAPRPQQSPKPATQPKLLNNHLNNSNIQYTSYGAPITNPPVYQTVQQRTSVSVVRTTTYTSAATAPSRQPRPTFYMAQNQTTAPPPLVRGNQTSPLYSNTQQANNFLMLSEPDVGQNYRQNTQMHKYPPPLIPVRHFNNDHRYETPQQNHYRPNVDVVDLSGNNSAAMPPHQPIINQQPAHQQSSRITPQDDRSNLTNGRIPVNSVQRKNAAIADTATSGNHIPYKMHKALIENKMIPCINMKPYVYTELLVTIPDLIEQLFNNVPSQSCQQVMQVLGIELYKGNNSQMRVLYENGKCQSVNDFIPLVPVRSVLEFMPQLKYMLGGLIGSDISSKRQRTS